MARDDWLMGALAAQDAYRGDWPAEPRTRAFAPPSGTNAALADIMLSEPTDYPTNEPTRGTPPVDNPWARGVQAAADIQAAPRPTLPPAPGWIGNAREIGGRMGDLANQWMETFRAPAGYAQQNPFPPGSEQWQHLENVKADRAAQFGGEWALNTLGLGRLGGGVHGGVGIGGGRIVQPSEAPMGELAKPFYSAVEQAVTGAKQAQAPAGQWLGTLRNAPGVKPEEIERLGLERWLQQQPGPVSRQQLADFVAANKVNVGEVVKGRPYDTKAITVKRIGEGPNAYWESFDASGNMIVRHPGSMSEAQALQDASRFANIGPTASTKFSSYQLPGGENYRETLLTLPQEPRQFGIFQGEQQVGQRLFTDPDAARNAAIEMRNADQLVGRSTIRQVNDPAAPFTQSHWDEPNVIAHYRANDRDIGGKKTLFLEEVQSDWHQKGRQQGYAIAEAERQQLAKELQDIQVARASESDPERYRQLAAREAELTDRYNRGVHDAIPDAPFKTTWPELTLKRAIRDAAEGGYEQLAWTPGKVQAERYDLSKHIGKLDAWENLDLAGNPEGTWSLVAHDPAGKRVVINEGPLQASELPNYIGKELADKVISQGGGTFHGLDLQVGGEGMKGFYDKMLPTAANKIGKKYGAQVGQGEIVTGDTSRFDLVPRGGGWRLSTPEGEIIGPHFRSGADAEAWLRVHGPSRQTVHTLPITPQLRETALRKGFPLFTLGAATTMGGLAAQDRYQQE